MNKAVDRGDKRFTITPLGALPVAIAGVSTIRATVPGALIFIPTKGACFSSGIHNIVIEDGLQMLDCTRSDRVVFINMRIVYRGGSVQLRDVYFINCTFDFPLPNMANADQLAGAVAEGLTSIRIG